MQESCGMLSGAFKQLMIRLDAYYTGRIASASYFQSILTTGWRHRSVCYKGERC